jgi:competence protein ComGC
MKSKILSRSLVAFMIIISVLFVFFALKIIIPTVQKERLTLASKYAESHQSSYLWQLALINPDKNNLNLALENLITSGDIKGAKLLNIWVRDPKFKLKVVEDSILNQSEYNHLGCYESLEPTEKEEISYFLNLKDGNRSKPNPERPTTNLGKIAKMIYQDNFDLYTVDNNLGAEIQKQTEAYKNKTEQRLAVASIFLNYGFPKIALGLIETTTKENPCLHQALNLEIKIYDEINKPDEIIRSIDNLLHCYPDNQVALEKAISVTKKHGLDPDNYQTRLEELHRINK